MRDTEHRAVAIVGLGAILPDAPDAEAFWTNIKGGRYSVTDVSPDRWDPELYYDPDPAAPDKSYSKIGGWVREFEWDPIAWKMPIPPTVSQRMDDAQRWAVSATRAALVDYGYPQRPLDPERVAVILGNAMSGELHYETALRIYFPEFARHLGQASAFRELPDAVRRTITSEAHDSLSGVILSITEDTMPGELGNCIAGRIANLFNFRGPNYITDAACASAMAAMSAAIEGLIQRQFDAVITGGIDRNMGASSYVKFCKIRALSATGTRPYAEGADGFVMGEGAAIFLIKRLADAERDGDRVYAVIRGVGGSSDGKGKGITAPNPVGQRLAVERGWEVAGLSPATASYVEGHGTSTPVGDVVEVQGLTEVFVSAGAERGSVRLGSVKSNLGHLKGAAGAAGILKTTLALYEKVIPPSINFNRPNPNIDFAGCPFEVNAELSDWRKPSSGIRRAGVSAFGFGGTNFHVVMEEHVPGMLKSARPVQVAVAQEIGGPPQVEADAARTPLAPTLVLGAATVSELVERLRGVKAEADGGRVPIAKAPLRRDLKAEERIVIDFEDAEDLSKKAEKALETLGGEEQRRWQVLASQGVFRGKGPPAPLAFLYTGQGSQYVNMLRELRGKQGLVAEVFEEADRVMTPLLGRPLTDFVFVDTLEKEAVSRAEEALRQTAITQPAVLSVDTALTRLLAAYGIRPDMVMGHSLGEYGALVASEALSFADALEAVSARGREMTRVSVGDSGAMAAVSAPLEEIENVLSEIDGYVVIANINSGVQAVIGGEADAVARALKAFEERNIRAVPLTVSHAFHTRMVEPASAPLREVLDRQNLRIPRIPVVSNVTGRFYPTGANARSEILDLLAQQVASPVQFVAGLETLYEAGARTFVEVGPKRALTGFVHDVLGGRPGMLALYSNHPRMGDERSFNRCLSGLYAAGHGEGRADELPPEVPAPPVSDMTSATSTTPAVAAGSTPDAPAAVRAEPITLPGPGADAEGSPHSVTPRGGQDLRPGQGAGYEELGRMVTDLLQRAGEIFSGRGPAAPTPSRKRIVVSGAAFGLPGAPKVFDDGNLARILGGEVLIGSVPPELQERMANMRVTRLVKRANGEHSFETIDQVTDVIKLAGRAGEFDLAREFGVDEERIASLDTATRLAIGAGIDALRDAGIPLQQRYRATSAGTHLPEGWKLPEPLVDDTGVIFASAFPGVHALMEDAAAYHGDSGRRRHLGELEALREDLASKSEVPSAALEAVDRRIGALRRAIDENPFAFDRRYLFRVLSMGHSQFAQEVGARGPNTQVNAACASTTQAIGLAEDWIRSGRCRRVVIVAGDDVTEDGMMEWFGAGFLASGAAATDEAVEDAALPFDRRRHGMLMGMGGAAIVVEEAKALSDRGMQPICEVLGTVSANSAFHGTRLDVNHISQMMEQLVSEVEQRWGVSRRELAPRTVFISHETYTPARGGSASAEVHALRNVFGPHADEIVIANTKGFTGHAMAVGIEDVLAIKSLETGIVPPVPNHRDVDPELGHLNLSKGGSYPVQFALRLGAGFGSQVSMALLAWVPTADGRRRPPGELGFRYRVTDGAAFSRWLARVSGYAEATLEVEHRRLRIQDQGPPSGRPVIEEAPIALPHGVPRVAARPAVERGETPSKPPVPPSDEPPTAIQLIPAGVSAPARGPEAPEVPAVVADGGAVAGVVGSIEARVLEIVAEQTGYPQDMLDLDLDLEADLGIDTVKQAETFAAIREAWDIPRDESLQLRDYPTLSHVVQFVRERVPAETHGEVKPGERKDGTEGRGEEAEVGRTSQLTGDLTAAAAVRRRVPTAMWRPPLTACKETGITLQKGTRVVVMPDEGGVARALLTRLSKRGVQPLILDPALGPEALETQVEAWLAEGEVTGVYWLAGLDPDPSIEEVDLESWKDHLDCRVKLLYRTMRKLYEHVWGSGTFLIAGTRMGGRHGYDARGSENPMGGAISGFVKSYKRERVGALCKVVDFGVSRKTAALADILIGETLHDPGVVEVGIHSGQRWTVGLRDLPLGNEEEGLRLGGDSVFVVTGAAGSIVSAIVSDLARVAGGGVFHLLDLAAEPDPEDPELQKFRVDRDGLKRDIFERLKAGGGRATPAMVERELARLERAEAAASAIESIRRAGGSARYHEVDLRDPVAVSRVMGEVRENSQRVDVLVHAAGIEISHLLVDKDPGEYDLVFDVKADGWFNLLKGLGDHPLRSAVVFSSIAGRFGNGGQTDYSAANDLLCKYVSWFRNGRPGTRGLAIDWTAWDQIGMASRGSVPKMMQQAGIGLLPPPAGIPVVGRELSLGGGSSEVVIAGELGALLHEWDPTGGLEVGALHTGSQGPMVGRVKSLGLYEGLVVETPLDPSEQPFLFDHKIDGTPVLPGVMGLEGFAEVARLAMPDWQVRSVENVRFLAPFKFYRGEGREVRLVARPYADGNDVVVECELIGSRSLVGQEKPQVTTHFTALVRLSAAPPEPVERTEVLQAARSADAADSRVTSASVYQVYFHGPAYQVVDSAWRFGTEGVVGRMAEELPPNHDPADQPLALSPRDVELCFQTAGVYEMGESGKMGLPLGIQRLDWYGEPSKGPRLAVVTRTADGLGFDASVLDSSGKECLRLHDYRTVELPGGAEPEKLRPLRAVAASGGT